MTVRGVLKNIGLFLWFYCFLAFAQHPFVQHTDEITTLPGLKQINNLEFAGYLPLSQSNTSGKLFYWFVENRVHSPNAPIVLWLNGGPGAASLYGFFMENGPYSVNQDGTLSERLYAWNQQADYLVIDQPAGVGLSYGNPKTFANEAEAMDQLYYALKAFFQKHPELSAKSVYLAGESYAGKYIPQLALRILSDHEHTPKIHLKGILLGDPWVNPRLQQLADAEFAYAHGLIDRYGYIKVLQLYARCKKEIDKATPSSRQANQVCGQLQDFIQKQSGYLDLTNICIGTQPDDATMVRYLNNPQVRNALHINPGVQEFKTFSDSVSHKLEVGEQDSVAPLYATLLAAGLHIWIYNGLEDAKDSNFIGTDLWLSQLNWPHKKAFATAPTCVWRVKGSVAGYAKTAAGLTQIEIRHAGHLAPIDQPAVVLNLLNHFINHQDLCAQQ